MARIGGMPKAATGLSEAREAAGAIAKSRIACFLVAERIRSKQKATQNIKKLKTQNLVSKVKKNYLHSSKNAGFGFPFTSKSNGASVRPGTGKSFFQLNLSVMPHKTTSCKMPLSASFLKQSKICL